MEATSVVMETGDAQADDPAEATITFLGVAHVALTVTDLDRSVAWYSALWASSPDHVHDGESMRAAVWSLPGAVFVLHQFVPAARTARFDEFRPGLDHLAFRVQRPWDLEAWARRLDELGVAHADIVDAPYGSGLAFRDPDNIALEFFVPPVSPEQ